MSMFNRIKNIGETALSDALVPDFFRTDSLARYGFRGALSAFAFDPAQGLFAVGTSNGYIHVFGQKNVEYIFSLHQNLEVSFLSIVKSIYLVVVDLAHTVTVFSLDTKERLSTGSIPGRVTSIATDPAMDWLFLGTESGIIAVYDVDRGVNSTYSISNLQRSFLPKSKLSPVVSLQLHPRDPAKILACYTDCAIVFNLVSQEIVLGFRYELPSGAPGGDLNPIAISQYRSPPILQALWHPHGHHVLTVHIDGSLVFWDATEGVLLQARTLTDVDVNIPRRNIPSLGSTGIENNRITKVAWVCTQNPEETAIIVAGGHSFEGAIQGVTVLDFGVTPAVAITSYPNMGKLYANPRRQRILPMPEDAVVVDFIPLPKANPFYGGGCDPNAIIFQLASGEITTLTYPDGLPVTSVAAFPSTFAWVEPFINSCAVGSVQHNQWLGMMSSAPTAEPFFIGGAPVRRHLRKFETRTAFCTGHNDGCVRIWDASHGELDDSRVIEIPVSDALNRHNHNRVDKMSFAPTPAELAVAVETGEVVLYRFGSGKRLGSLTDRMAHMNVRDEGQVIQDIRFRTKLVKDGFLPQSLVDTRNGPVSTLVNSEIGFVAIGYTNGNITVVDQRGPAVIFSSLLSNLTVKKTKLHKSHAAGVTGEYPTSAQFGIYMLDGEKFSSIVLSVGSSLGKLHTFRVVPLPTGAYSLDYVGVTEASTSPIISVIPLDTEKGTSALARMAEMNQLPQGIQINGAIITISRTEIRLYRQPKDKVAARTLTTPLATGGLCYLKQPGTTCLVTVTEACEIVVYSLPTLGEIVKQRLPFAAAPDAIGESIVTPNGDIIVRRNKLSASLINIWGKGVDYDELYKDALYDAVKVMPLRPTISTMQWIKGTQIATLDDVDAIIGGARRPKSKTMIELERAQRDQQNLIQRDTIRRTGTATDANSSPFTTISRALDNLEESTNQYLNTLSESVTDTQKSTQNGILRSALKSKFGF